MYALNIDPSNPNGDPSPDQLRDLGVEMVRYTYHDSTSGDELSQAQADFFSGKARAYRQAGVRSLVILSYDTYPGKPAFEADASEWDAYIGRFARRAGQIAALLADAQPAFQVWNEPDHPCHPGYCPTVREGVYGHMLRETNQAIKAADPNAVVVTAGLATGNPGWLRRVIDLQGGKLHADIVAFHPYGQRPEPDWPHPDWFFGYVGNLLNGYFEAGQGRKLWITEMGSPERDLGDDRQQVGEFLRRYYRTMTAQFADKVEQLFWFCYSDGMVPTFGLLDEAGDPKPAFNVFRDVATSEVAFDLLTGVEPAATGESIPVTEALTPASSTFVVPFRQHVALEIARLESYIKLLQEQVKQLQERIQGLAGDEDE